DVDEVVSLLDLGPTLLDLVGIPPAPSFEGQSLRPVVMDAQRPLARLARLLGRRPPNRRPSFAELVPTVVDPPSGRPRHAIADVRRKLLETAAGSYDLFDPARDPREPAPHRLTATELDSFRPAVAWITQRAAAAATAGVQTEPVSPEELEQLRALGYVD